MSASDKNLYGILAEYKNPKELIDAARKVNQSGYTKFDTYSPFPIHGIDKAMSLKKSKLGWIVIGHGLLGFSGALAMMYFMSVMDYPLNISGKPFFNAPAWVPITFELTVLLSAFGAVFGMFFLNGLPKLYNPLFSVERFKKATDDGFFVCVEADDKQFESEKSAKTTYGCGCNSHRRSLRPITLGLIRFMTSRYSNKIAALLAAGFLFGACQGRISEKPPIHPNMNMDQQDRKEAQEENTFFADGRSMRQPVEGTIARGLQKEDLAYYEGVDARGNWIGEMPVDMTKDLLYRGKERYEIFCTPCHGTTGDGQGIIMVGKYGYVPAPSYHDQRLVDAPDGELYSAIYNGVRSMPSYATQIPVDDRWAIVAYIRALQRSQNVDEGQMQDFDVDLASLREDFQAEQERLAALAEARKPKDTPEPSADLGKNLIVQNACGACHNETGDPGGIGPTWKNVFGSTGEVITDAGETITVTKDAEYIIESIVNPIAKKSVEYAQGVMAPYALADFELQSIVEYIKTLSDN